MGGRALVQVLVRSNGCTNSVPDRRKQGTYTSNTQPDFSTNWGADASQDLLKTGNQWDPAKRISVDVHGRLLTSWMEQSQRVQRKPVQS
jgi:hypothetical protein